METKLRILIMDDEPDFRLALQMALEAKAYEVVTVSSRTEAQARVSREAPVLVVLGTMTPRGEAFLLHQWLKETRRFKDLPVLVIDASPEKCLVKGWSKQEGMLLQAEDYVCKPVEPALLVPRIQRLLDKVTRRIKILVADDHTVVRDGIRAVLSLQRDMEVVGEAADGRDAVEKVLVLFPDVVVMDILMPGMGGLEATKLIAKEHPQSRVLVLTQYDDKENLLTASQAGAYGFIPKRAASAQLVAGIRSVYAGKQFMEPFTTELAAQSERQSQN